MKVNVFGDLCPTDSNLQMFLDKKSGEIFGDVLPMIADADVSVVNLECAVGDRKVLIEKTGPQMVVDSVCLDTIADAGFSAVCLANNHAMDNGLESLNRAAARAETLGMQAVGVDSKEHQTQVCRFRKDGVQCSIVCVSDFEFNHSVETGGVNIYDPATIFLMLQREAEESDAVIVLYHTGLENYQYPTPGLQKRCRAMRVAGADAVICQHSHCIGTLEQNEDGFILYGQGNFLFDSTDRDIWRESLAVEIQIEKGRALVFHLIPTKCEKGRTRLARKEENNRILELLGSRTKRCAVPGFLEEHFSQYLSEQVWKYNAMLRGGSRLQYILFRCLSFVSSKLLLGKNRKLELTCLLRSDTQREAILQLLNLK